MKSIAVTGAVSLVPVVEVYGFDYSRLPTPEVRPARDHPAIWDDYFQRCMADAGFSGVRTIQPGSCFVAVAGLLDTALLDRLIRDRLADSGWPGFEEPEADADGETDGETDRAESSEVNVVSFSGGLALCVDGEPVITPSCCGDLGNLTSWEEALQTRPSEGKLWIGHPDIEVSFSERSVVLRETSEYGDEPDLLVEVTLPIDQLELAVVAARAELERLRPALEPAVARILGSSEHAAKVADLLLGFDSGYPRS